MNLKSMKMSPQEKKAQEPTALTDKQEYPYGLCLRLDEEAIEKLGLANLPAVDTTILIMAKSVVKSAAMSDYGDGKRRSLELQITDMTIEPEAKEKSTQEALYGG